MFHGRRRRTRRSRAFLTPRLEIPLIRGARRVWKTLATCPRSMTNLLDVNVSTSRYIPSSRRKVICKKREDYDSERGGFWNCCGGEDGQGWGVRIGGRVSEESNFHSQPLDWREITTLDPLETFPENLITNLCWSYESNQIRKFHSLETLFKLHISI